MGNGGGDGAFAAAEIFDNSQSLCPFSMSVYDGYKGHSLSQDYLIVLHLQLFHRASCHALEKIVVLHYMDFHRTIFHRCFHDKVIQ